MSTIISTGFILPQSVITNGQVTGNPFLNPNNILFADDLFAQGDNTADIIVGNFQFNIPSDAIITGVEFKVKGKRGQQITPPVTLTFYAVDNTSGTDVFYPYIAPFTGLTLSNVVHSFGTSSYLFATSFTADQANNLKLQIVSDGQVFIDDVLMNVYYYVPTPVVPIPSNALGCPDCNSPIQVQAMYLDLPFISGETKFYLKAGSWQYPDGTPVQPGDVGACGGEVVFVFDEGKPKSDGQNFEENVILDISSGFWTVLPSGVIEFDIGAVTNRGRQFHTPYGHDATLMSDHSANSKVIVSNSGLFYSRFVRRCEVDITFSPPIDVMFEGADVVNPAHTFNFQGGGVTVVQDPSDPFRANITIPGSGTTPPIVVDSVSNTSGNTQVITLTLSDLQVQGVDRGVLFQIATEQSKTVVSVVGNGSENFSFQVAKTDVTNNLRTEQWFLVAPTAGAMSITVTMSSVAYISCGAEALVGVDQSTPIGSNSNDSGSSNVPQTTNVTTYDNSLVFDSIATAQLPILYTKGSNQVLNWAQTVNPITRQGASSYQNAGTAPDNVVMSWILTQNTPWCMTSLEIKGITTSVLDEMVKVNGSDTTTGFLDDKIEILPASANVTIVKTILNPGGNEKIRYTIDATGGSGNGNNLVVDQTPLGTGSTYNLLAGTINGINTTFTVNAGLYISGTLIVFLNGQELQQGSASDWEETSPIVGTFDFIVAPIPGDIITVVYQTTNGTFGAQTGIQWEDEGINLGTPGTVNEVDFTGAGVTATRLGDKVTVNIPGGSGGGSTISLTAGEAIDGSTVPKAVFVGTAAPAAARANIIGGWTGTNDEYNTGSNAVNYGSLANLKFAYKMPAGKTYNASVFQVWNNNVGTATLTFEFYNSGATFPTGSIVSTWIVSIDTNIGSGLDPYYHSWGANCDCQAPGDYWIVVTFDSVAVDMAPKISASAPTFLEWNGSSWVTPFTHAGRLPGIDFGLSPRQGFAYASSGTDTFSTNIGTLNGLEYGRKRFLGFVDQNVPAGGTAVVQTDGSVNFPGGVPGQYVEIYLNGTGTVTGQSPSATGVVRVGVSYTNDDLRISRETKLITTLPDGTYQ